MSHKKTHEQFIQELLLINQNIDVLGIYKDAKTKIPVRCKICGYEWLALSNTVLRGSGCKRCAGTLKKTQEEFVSELAESNNTVTVIGIYKNNKTSIEVQCKKCGYVWHAVPYDLLKGTGCPQCAGNVKKTHEEFIDELLICNPDIAVLGQYVSTKTPIQVKCKLCGYTWNPTPHNLLRGTGCPKCMHIPTSFMEQFILAGLGRVLGKENVLHRDKYAIGKELDIYIPSYRMAIEPGAWYWHKKRLEWDKKKLDQCKKVGIDIIIIYDAFNGDERAFGSNYLLFKQDLGMEKDHAGLKQLLTTILARIGISYDFKDEEWKEIIAYAHRHSRRMTTEEFREKLLNISPEIIVLGEFKNARRNIRVKCSRCGYEWDASPDGLLNKGTGCPSCAHTLRKTNDQFISELAVANPNITVIGEYSGDSKKVKVCCRICGYEWEAIPSNLLRKEGCPKCAGNLKKTHSQFVQELSKKNPNIEILDQYTNSHAKIEAKCLICGHVWKTPPVSLLRGLGCPKCGIKKQSDARRKTHQQFVSELAMINPNLIVLGEYHSSNTKISLKCKKCNYEWEAKPSSFKKNC